MKKIYLVLAILTLSGCGYHKEGASMGQTYDDYVECNKKAQNQEKTLENECMAKLGYQAK